MWRLFCHFLFLIFPSFCDSVKLCFEIVAFPKYMHLYICSLNTLASLWRIYFTPFFCIASYSVIIVGRCCGQQSSWGNTTDGVWCSGLIRRPSHFYSSGDSQQKVARYYCRSRGYTFIRPRWYYINWASSSGKVHSNICKMHRFRSCWSVPTLSAYARRHVFAWRDPSCLSYLFGQIDLNKYSRHRYQSQIRWIQTILLTLNNQYGKGPGWLNILGLFWNIKNE